MNDVLKCPKCSKEVSKKDFYKAMYEGKASGKCPCGFKFVLINEEINK